MTNNHQTVKRIEAKTTPVNFSIFSLDKKSNGNNYIDYNHDGHDENHKRDTTDQDREKFGMDMIKFHHVIPFLSHSRRKVVEKNQDENEFGGINRCVFSNLYEDKNFPLIIPKMRPLDGNNNTADDIHNTNRRQYEEERKLFLGHGSNYETAICAESFYMAAKAKYACDAKFIMEELKSSYDVATYGHNHLHLTTEQKNRLIEFGANPNDFVRVETNSTNIDSDGTKSNDKNEYDNGNDTREGNEKNEQRGNENENIVNGNDDVDTTSLWLRGADGIMPVRDGWHDIRFNVFLYILRHKFGVFTSMETNNGDDDDDDDSQPKKNEEASGQEQENENMSEVKKTIEGLVYMINVKEEIPFFIEHRRRDTFWGDGGFPGNGFNVLGKIITQVILEVSEIRRRRQQQKQNGNGYSPSNSLMMELAPYMSIEDAKRYLFRPNHELVSYIVEEPYNEDSYPKYHDYT